MVAPTVYDSVAVSYLGGIAALREGASLALQRGDEVVAEVDPRDEARPGSNVRSIRRVPLFRPHPRVHQRRASRALVILDCPKHERLHDIRPVRHDTHPSPVGAMRHQQEVGLGEGANVLSVKRRRVAVEGGAALMVSGVHRRPSLLLQHLLQKKKNHLWMKSLKDILKIRIE